MGAGTIRISIVSAIAAIVVGCKDLPDTLPTAPAAAPAAANFSRTATVLSLAGLADASERMVALIANENIRSDLRKHITALNDAVAAGDLRKADDALDKAERDLNKVASSGRIVETPEIAGIRVALATARLSLNATGK